MILISSPPSPRSSDSDCTFMARALRLAALGRHASPNPMVGCVIVADGRIVGEGYHHAPGSPHAEGNALVHAGEHARGATAYVTLEPCSHFGRTPPCANALIAAGVRRVVVAQTDPDQRVSGTGIGILRAAGVDVIVGVCEAEAKRLNEAYLHQRITGMPFVTLKTAITLDGKVATRSGDSRWITSPTTRKWAHRVLRNRADAIVVGVGTVIEDDPDLTVRLGHGAVRNPFRVVLDTRLRIPANSRIVTRAGQDGKTIVVHGGDAPSKARASLADAGVTLMEMPILDDGYGRRSIDVRALFQHLGTSGLATGVLVEGGATVAWDLMKSCLIDRYCWCVAPKIVGGAGAPSSVGGVGFERMADARPLRWESARRSGPDVIVFARPL